MVRKWGEVFENGQKNRREFQTLVITKTQKGYYKREKGKSKQTKWGFC